MILCHTVLTRDPVMTIFGELLMCVQVVVTFMHVRQVSVLPPGIDVRKLQRSHSELSRVEQLSGLPSRLFSVYLSGLPIRFSVFTHTLSDLTLDWSKVRSDKLLCVNTALENCIMNLRGQSQFNILSWTLFFRASTCVFVYQITCKHSYRGPPHRPVRRHWLQVLVYPVPGHGVRVVRRFNHVERPQ